MMMKQQWIVAKNKIIKIVIVAIVVYLLLLIMRVIGTSLPNHLSYHLTNVFNIMIQHVCLQW